MIPASFEDATAVRFGDRAMLCPVCKVHGEDNEYVHIRDVRVNQNGLVTTVNARGDFLDPDGKSGQRGSIVTVGYWCESGHQFEHAFQFHKGNVICNISRLPDCGFESEEGWSITVTELWRD